jgi:hypothetical protein
VSFKIQNNLENPETINSNPLTDHPCHLFAANFQHGRLNGHHKPSLIEVVVNRLVTPASATSRIDAPLNPSTKIARRIQNRLW